MTKQSRYAPDAPEIGRDEATEILVWHLRMAASLFQVIPDDMNTSLELELRRQCQEEVELAPALAWSRKILEIYEKMRRDGE